MYRVPRRRFGMSSQQSSGRERKNYVPHLWYMRFGIVLDKGSDDCKHQSLGSICGYEHCMSCSYKFVGHCTECEARTQALLKFFGFNQSKVDELNEKLNETR